MTGEMTGEMTRRMVALAAALASLAAGVAAQDAWKQAQPGRAIVLPADHASHPDYRVEWWYYTGNLGTADGRRFGYQLTFFRIGIDLRPVVQSRWAVRDLFMAHFAVTDVQGKRYRFAERLNRAGPGWAGADTNRYRVWNEDWSVAQLPNHDHLLKAAADGIGIELTARETRPPVLHGRSGYSQKGADFGNASYYYSLTRMPTAGRITIDGRTIEVSGSSWMDHEFGTSFLESTQRGWDWMALQLEDGRDLMIYRLRRGDGTVDPHSSATLVEADGRTVSLGATDFSLEPGRRWTSRETDARYPVEWRVRIPGRDGDIAVTAAVDDQEMRAERSSGVSYWEGAIDVAGRLGGRPVKGRGYLEMTGYAGGPLGRMFEAGR